MGQFEIECGGKGVGDAETAGKATAATKINGPALSKPVDTMAKVGDTRDPAASDDG